MPKTTITHEPWCDEHIDEAGWNCCTSKMQYFGAGVVATDGVEDSSGSIYATQDMGDKEPAFILVHGKSSGGRIELDGLKALLSALDDSPESLRAAAHAALHAIEVSG